MGLGELFLIAVGLSMDAFAVATCKGLSLKRIQPKHALIAGAYFGGFQALMPLLGYFLGLRFETIITNYDHWIAFVLLGIIGINMIRESRGAGESLSDSFGLKTMIPLAVATSIDALVVGVSFAFLKVEIVPAVFFIGSVTFVLAGVGIKVGNLFGCKCKAKAELLGGVILIFMGGKIVLEHLGLLPF